MLPSRRKRPKMGVQKPPQRVFPTHRAYVKRHGCSIPDCTDGPIEFAHLRNAANSGVGLKPADQFGIPLCRAHHHRAHNIGHDAMARENGTTLEALYRVAAEFARRSPDRALREQMREAAGADLP